MKRILAFLFLLTPLFLLAVLSGLFILMLSGCGESSTNKTKISALESIKTYRDIPGVDENDINAIEKLKAEKEKFTYGVLISTEAFELPGGSNSGFAVKFCGLMSELFGIDIVNQFYEWDELIEGLENLSVDFIGELTPTEERLQMYGMTLPVAERMLRIFTRIDSEMIKSGNDINGCKIGFLEGAVTPDSIKKVYPVSFTVVEAADYHMAAEMIKNGEIDAFVDEAVADPAFDDYDFIRSEIVFPMVHESVSLTTANPDLYPVIAVLNKYILAGGVDCLYDMYHDGEFEYSKCKLQKSFTAEEKAYIDDLNNRGETVKVAFEYDNYPVNFYNAKEHEFQGIAIDVLAEISRLTNIKFEPAYSKGAVWANILDDAASGNIPMLAELLYSNERKDRFIWGEAPYSRSYYAIMSKSDLPNLASYQVMRYTVGVIAKSAHEDIYRELFPENNNLKRYKTLEECLNALEKGEIDLLMGSEHILLTQTNYREKSGFKINIRLNSAKDSYFGFNKNETVLCSIISKAQRYVGCEMIDMSWMGRTFDYTKKILEDRAVFFSIFAGVLSIILVGSGFLLIKLLKVSKKLKEIASHDALTGIFNRRSFTELALMQIERSNRTNIDCYVAIYDLDRFKAVNDTYGHQGGDKVLKEVAGRVKKMIRPYDLFGRYGGEEFIILLADIKEINKENAKNIMERIRLDISGAPVEFNGKEIPVTASFGIAYAAPKNDLETAIKFADEALYQAKNSGRNKVVFYEDHE